MAADPDPAVASMLKGNLPTTTTPKKKKILKIVGIVVASIAFILILSWMSGRMSGTNRNAARKGGYNKPDIRAAGLKVKWADAGIDDKRKRDFSIAIRDGTTPDEQQSIRGIYLNKTSEDRDATTRWFISNHYGTSNPDPEKVKMFTSIIVDGADAGIDGGALDDDVQEDMDIVEKVAELTKFDVGESTKRLYNPETGMCLTRDDSNTRGGGFKAELVECGGATGFDIVGETLVAGVPGESVCFPFNKSKSANVKISSARSADAKDVYVSTHPCNMDLYDANKDDDGYFVGVGPRCFTTDASGKNLKVSSSNCHKKDKRARFELKETSEIVSSVGVQDAPGA